MLSFFYNVCVCFYLLFKLLNKFLFKNNNFGQFLSPFSTIAICYVTYCNKYRKKMSHCDQPLLLMWHLVTLGYFSSPLPKKSVTYFMRGVTLQVFLLVRGTDQNHKFKPKSGRRDVLPRIRGLQRILKVYFMIFPKKLNPLHIR